MKNICLSGMNSSVSPLRGSLKGLYTFSVTIMPPLRGYDNRQSPDSSIMLNIEQGHTDVETAVDNNLSFLQNLANTESAPGEITAQVLLEQAGVDTFPEVIRLPEPMPEPKNLILEESENEDASNDVDDVVNVYPNPASDKIYIEYAFLNKDKNRSIRIYNTTGVLVDQINLHNAIGLFNYTNDLPAGNYIVKVGKNYSQQITIL